jgi:hypothetical protein
MVKKLFLGWSEHGSKAVAGEIKRALKDIFKTDIDCFISDNIEGGSNWHNKLQTELQTCDLGIICVTRENINSSMWLYFEAGALWCQDKIFILTTNVNINHDSPFYSLQYKELTNRDDFRNLVELVNKKTKTYAVAKMEMLKRKTETVYVGMMQKLAPALKSLRESAKGLCLLYPSNFMKNPKRLTEYADGLTQILKKESFKVTPLTMDAGNNFQKIAPKIETAEYLLLICHEKNASDIFSALGYGMALNKNLILFVDTTLATQIQTQIIHRDNVKVFTYNTPEDILRLAQTIRFSNLF